MLMQTAWFSSSRLGSFVISVLCKCYFYLFHLTNSSSFFRRICLMLLPITTETPFTYCLRRKEKWDLFNRMSRINISQKKKLPICFIWQTCIMWRHKKQVYLSCLCWYKKGLKHIFGLAYTDHTNNLVDNAFTFNLCPICHWTIEIHYLAIFVRENSVIEDWAYSGRKWYLIQW